MAGVPDARDPIRRKYHIVPLVADVAYWKNKVVCEKLLAAVTG
jgi:hypothetical protein